MTYGSLGSGILTGKYKMPPSFKGNDARNFFYPFYKEPYWSRTKDLIAEMEKITKEHNKPVAEIAINWINQQEGIATALVGARNSEQVEINAGAGEWELSKKELELIESAYNRIFGKQ